tara:strand:+ start:1560 stop:2150 length:591 start_codon:yes stop_codon:yes gene_type:complete
MKKEHQKTQIILISIGIFLILATYFFYPYMKKTQFAKNKSIQEDVMESADEDQESTFENIQYQGIYDLDKTFTVNSEKAYILKNDPDIVYMTNMHVILYLSKGRVVNIVSSQGRYNKVTYDCFFEKNVKAVDGETKILAENLDLLATENLVNIYNNVRINYPTGSLEADKIDYDFETKYFKVSMFNDEAVKMKVFK